MAAQAPPRCPLGPGQLLHRRTRTTTISRIILPAPGCRRWPAGMHGACCKQLAAAPSSLLALKPAEHRVTHSRSLTMLLDVAVRRTAPAGMAATAPTAAPLSAGKSPRPWKPASGYQALQPSVPTRPAKHPSQASTGTPSNGCCCTAVLLHRCSPAAPPPAPTCLTQTGHAFTMAAHCVQGCRHAVPHRRSNAPS